jgi:hypothetical protein
MTFNYRELTASTGMTITDRDVVVVYIAVVQVS